MKHGSDPLKLPVLWLQSSALDCSCHPSHLLRKSESHDEMPSTWNLRERSLKNTKRSIGYLLPRMHKGTCSDPISYQTCSITGLKMGQNRCHRLIWIAKLRYGPQFHIPQIHPHHICLDILKELGKWLANNWHPYSTEKASKGDIRANRNNIICKNMEEEVLAEVKRILNVEDINKSSQDYFQNRTKAASNIYEWMSEQERQKIKDLVEKYKIEGNTLEVQSK